MEKSKDWIVRVAIEVTLSFSSEEPIDVNTLLPYFKSDTFNDHGVVEIISQQFAYVVSTEPIGEVVDNTSDT